jgi:hypothetical protein
MENIKNLLQHVKIIKKKYDDISEITGENYNIFDILNINCEELKHSLFISNLLDTKGKHKQNDLFLKLFIDEIQDKFISDKNVILKHFNTEKSISITENHIGYKSEDRSNGGRIDILINDGHYNIIIENKINAGDQEKQMYRYYNFDKNAPLIYLTLRDELPSKESITHENETLRENIDFISISYKNEIKNWIQSCIKAAFNKPLIRETLIQYQFLINELTNQSNNNKMSQEIRSLINNENIELIALLNNEVQIITKELKEQVLNSFKNEPIEKINSEIDLKVVIGEDGDGLFIGYSLLKDDKNISNEHKNKGYFEIFSKANPDLKIYSTDWLFVWYNPLDYVKKQKLFHDKNNNINYKEIIDFYQNNKLSLLEFIENLKTEEREYRKRFISILKTNNENENS